MKSPPLEARQIRISRVLKKKLIEAILKFSVPGFTGVPSAALSRVGWQPRRQASTPSAVSRTRGRPTREATTSDKYLVEPLPTIKAAVRGCRRMPLIPLPRSKWRRALRVSRVQVAAMLIMDASRSSLEYMVSLSEVLRSLFEKYFDPASKVGMVAIEEGRAKLLFSPTRNRLRVFGRVKELKAGGFTPLGKALQQARRELLRLRRMDTIYRTFVILVSDCYPEPLPEGVADIYGSEVYKGVRQQARLLKGSRIPVAVIDPSFARPQVAEQLPGRRLARFVATTTGGTFIPVPAAQMELEGTLTPRFIVEARKNLETYRIAEQLHALEDAFSRERMRGF